MWHLSHSYLALLILRAYVAQVIEFPSKNQSMAVLRGLLVALSLFLLTTLYSEILDYEGELANQEKGSEISAPVDAAETWSSEGSYAGVAVHDFELKGNSGSFESPNFPAAANSVDYVWVITVPTPNTVRLVFVEFDTEADNDYVFVHDGPTTGHPLLLVHSGKNKPSAVRSTGNQLVVRFVTNNKIPSRGFQANYYGTPPCFGITHFSTGMVESPNYPFKYDNNVNCEWLISVGTSEVILFELSDVDTEEDYDVIQIFDGESDEAPFLQRISGDYRGKVIVFMSNSNKALIRFTSDKSITRTGFAAKFYAGSRADLLERLVSDHSVLSKTFDDITDSLLNDGDPMDEANIESSLNGAELATVVAYLSDVLKSSNNTDAEAQ